MSSTRPGRARPHWLPASAPLGAALLLAGSLACSPSQGPRWAETSAPAARVNQVGYFTHGPKQAVVRSSSPTPLPAELHQGGTTVWRGTTRPRGQDPASGDPIHQLDFAEFERAGQGYTLVVEGSESLPFTIADDIYARLPYDALHYFYHNRSGVPIVRPYVPSDEWARQPGHLSDSSVPCFRTSDCDYRVDVHGGWYDAGDQGKYVVNGGIAAWTLFALYERSRQLAGRDPFPDGSGNIPESHNGVSDLLDEARFEVEFLLAMQVPEGKPLAGMAFHKVHDGGWTPLPFEPPTQTNSRSVHPPSTAATLNLAAVAAQAARLFREADPAFSARCAKAARRAFQAAIEHPAILAPAMDNQGGGPYDDRFVDDEFYWAAIELWLLEPSAELAERIRSSPHHRNFPTRLKHSDGSFDGDGVSASFTWQSTAALGWIDLAITPSTWDEAERQRLRGGIVDAAREYADIQEREGYPVPLSLGPSGKYPWGSNSFVLGNAVVLSLGYDLSHDERYARAVARSLDYVLGTNPLLFSYVSGYGSRSLENPHHRFWAHSKSRSFPGPPPGAVSGGPNSSLQDPQTKKSGLSRELPPQKCYVDHIEAWSVNEVAINWNAPLTWVATFLDEWRGARAADAGAAK
ncbi:MAG TPA: glycoside hydrolase family 9 protein [Polyangiaceae bacterium]|nr:glycoside hydrolase family 9 protein [Polyangiaceae bacterium]